MSWGGVRGHDRVRDSLEAALREGRFPHALLFVGPAGVGKRAAALVIARALLCERNRAPDGEPASLQPCDACPSCKRALAGVHPDIHLAAKPEDRTELPIALIRDLAAELALKPMEADRRVAVLDDADDLSEEAANAFLKTLEEPPPRSLLILVGTSPEAQLDTILSRCRVVRFAPLADQDLAAILLDAGIADSPETARTLAQAAEGSLARAAGIADPAFAQFRRRMLDALADTARFDPPGFAKLLMSHVEEAGKDANPRRRRASLLMGELARTFRAVLWQTAGLEPPANDPQDHARHQALAQALEPEDVFLLVERALQADAQIQRMAYLPGVMFALAADLAKTLARDAPRPADRQPR